MKFLPKLMLIALMPFMPLSYAHASIAQAQAEVEELFEKKVEYLRVPKSTTNEEHFFHFLTKKLDSDPTIKSVDFTNINLSGLGILCVGEILDQNKSIEKMILTNCHLSDSDLEEIESALEYNNSLKYIDIRNNFVSKEAQEKFKEALETKNIIVKSDFLLENKIYPFGIDLNPNLSTSNIEVN